MNLPQFHRLDWENEDDLKKKNKTKYKQTKQNTKTGKQANKILAKLDYSFERGFFFVITRL